MTRGFVEMEATGIYEFRPGHGGSAENIMEVDGKEAYRKEVGQEALHTDIKLTAGKKVPFKITYLTNDVNGLGWYAQLDVPGALSTVVKYKGKYPYLMNKKGQWVSRDDVYYKGVVTATGSAWLNPLAAGGRIGPELGFGHVVGDGIDEPVLILKTSQGNRALGWDFLPPGSKQYEYDAAKNEKWILDAQLAVDGEAGKYPDYKGNVSTVYTHPLSQGGASNSHYNRNAQTYMDVGLAMGEAMMKLLKSE